LPVWLSEIADIENRYHVEYAFCVALGFLFHRSSGSVLLQLKGAGAPWFPRMWELFGGRMEERDADDPVAAWCRELKEEIGVTLLAEQAHPVDDYVNEYGFRRVVFYAAWPTLQRDFHLTEGAGYEWFPIDEAARLPNISPLARRDVLALARTIERAR